MTFRDEQSKKITKIIGTENFRTSSTAKVTFANIPADAL